MFLTTEQKLYIVENCSEFLASPFQLTRERPRTNVKVFAVNKVRWSGVERSAIGETLDALVGVKDIIGRSVIVDWTGDRHNSVYIFPFNGWRWIPALSTKLLAELGTDLASDVIYEQVTNCGELSDLVERKCPIALVGMTKFVSIRTAAYPTFTKLITELGASL